MDRMLTDQELVNKIDKAFDRTNDFLNKIEAYLDNDTPEDTNRAGFLIRMMVSEEQELNRLEKELNRRKESFII